MDLEDIEIELCGEMFFIKDKNHEFIQSICNDCSHGCMKNRDVCITRTMEAIKTMEVINDGTKH